ncbi:MAG: phospholipid/cholesterol/gamma-HCH transport system substrate-binding protein [Solirubrobacteraceae bacterium]|nr:phospholipid/cholesterol/gamma-HCH transport system substrate-binding protein [Solirubrobacteraceae bacterium]
MKTSGATRAQLLAMTIFAFSCFSLLLFLWLSFGGSIPLKPKGYRFEISFPEATTLADEADVRVAGVSVGKVTDLERDPNGNLSLATIEMKREYAPVHKDAKAILRQKTLLGETYVELSLGHKDTPTIPENGRLGHGQVEPAVELDEVLELFPPKTRKDFQRWQANSAQAIRGRGQDLNDALGNIAGFSEKGADLFTVLDRRAATLQSLVRNTGNVFEALTRDEGQFRAFIADTEDWLQATASQREALAESIQIFPTFLRESRTTLTRLETFAGDTKPLIDDLGPVARDLRPTLRDLRVASPDLENFFNSLPAVIRASRSGLPSLSKVLRGLRPVLNATGPLLAQLNPVLQWLTYQQGTVTNFLAMPGWALNGKAATSVPGSNGHVLPQLITAGSQTIVSPTRSADNRGNTYLAPDAINLTTYRQGFFILPNWDCNAAGGEHKPTNGNPGCVVQSDLVFKGSRGHFPHILASDFKSGTR